MKILQVYPIDEPLIPTLNLTPLLYAAHANKTNWVMYAILEKGPDLYFADKSGRTALHHCCRSGNLRTFNFLKQKYREAEQQDDTGKTSAFERRTNGGLTPLMCAIQSGEAYLVEECLNSGLNPFAVDYLGQSCMDYTNRNNEITNYGAIRQIIKGAQA